MQKEKFNSIFFKFYMKLLILSFALLSQSLGALLKGNDDSLIVKYNFVNISKKQSFSSVSTDILGPLEAL